MKITKFTNPTSIVLVASTRNPLGVTWMLGLLEMGARLAVLDLDGRQWTCDVRKSLGVPDDLIILPIAPAHDESASQTISQGIGKPDIIFGWWGSKAVVPMNEVHRCFPNARRILCLDTFPDASFPLTELREWYRLKQIGDIADGFIFYSNAMRERFNKLFASSRGRPSLVLVEPFLLRTYASEDHPALLSQRHNVRNVIFTGRGDHLWTTDFRMKKDALGPFLAELAREEVNVYVPHDSDTRNHRSIIRYPKFSETQLLNGEFSNYVSRFDAHLAIYNEHNSTIRRRVRSSLCTRLAFALTSTCPIAITKNSSFAHEFEKNEQIFLVFQDVDDLVSQLENATLLSRLRGNLARTRYGFSFEAQSQHLVNLFQEASWA